MLIGGAALRGAARRGALLPSTMAPLSPGRRGARPIASSVESVAAGCTITAMRPTDRCTAVRCYRYRDPTFVPPPSFALVTM